MNILHVVTAVFLIGPMALLPMTAMRALRSGRGAQVASLAKSTMVISWASLVVVLFGFGLLGMSDPQYNLSVTTPWVLYSIIAYVIALLLNLILVVPGMNHAALALQPAAGTASGTAAAPAGGYARIAISSGISALLLILVVVLMVWKP